MKHNKKSFNGLVVMKVAIYTFFIMFLILPLFSVFLVSFTGQPVNILGSLTNGEILRETIAKFKEASFANYQSIFTSKTYFNALVNSLKLALLVSIIVIFLCIPIAYGIARTNMPFKKTISALCTVPLIVPTFISAYAFIIMFGRSGWVTYLYQMLGGKDLFIDPYSMTGIMLSL